MKKFEIINKVYTSKKHSGKKRLFMKLAVCLCLAFIILSLIIGKGFTAAVAPVSLLLAINLGGLAANNTNKRGEYQNVPCLLAITDSQISIENQRIDRHNGLGICTERTIFNWLDIKTIHYSSVLNSIRFNGHGNRIIYWHGTGGKEREKVQKISVDYIYLDNENVNVVLDEIKKYSRIEIIVVD